MTSIAKLISNSYEGNYDILKKEEFLINLILEIKFYKILDINELDLLKVINCVLDNLELLTEEYRVTFEIILEQLGLWAHKTDKKILKNNFIREKIYTDQKLHANVMTKDQKKMYMMLESFLLSEKKTLFLSAPTSFGKSFIISAALSNYKKILINVPTKSLLTEYCKTYSNKRICTNPHMFNIEEYDVFIGTPERILLLEKHEFDIAITDEGYNVSQFEDRDLIFIISQKILKCKNIVLLPNIRIDSLIRNYKEADINIAPYEKMEFRYQSSPVTFNEYNLHVNNGIANFSFNNKKREYKFVSDENSKVELANAITYIKKEYPFLLKNTIIYFPTRKVSKFIEALPSLESNSQLQDEGLMILKHHIKTRIHPQCEILNYLDKGIGVHNSNLDDFTKKMMEHLFLTKKIMFLVSTSTIAKGVNLPCKNLFFVTQRFNETVIDGKNTLGRAGRFKLYNNGNRIFVNLNKSAKDSEKISKIKSDELVNVEKFKPSIKPEVLSLIEEDSTFSEKFKLKHEIKQHENYTNSFDYFTGYTIKNAIKYYVSKQNKNKLIHLFNNINQYQQLIDLFEDLQKILLQNTRILFNGRSYKQYAYVYSFIKSERSLYEYISTSLNNCKSWCVNMKTETINFDNKGNIKFDSNNTRHINIFINYTMELFNTVEFEVQKLINLLLKYTEKIHGINLDLINLSSETTSQEHNKLTMQLTSLNITFDFVQDAILKYTDNHTSFESIKEVKKFVNSKMQSEAEIIYIINNIF